MYVLSNSLLNQVGEYRVEMYSMTILKHSANVDIDLKSFAKMKSKPTWLNMKLKIQMEKLQGVLALITY